MIWNEIVAHLQGNPWTACVAVFVTSLLHEDIATLAAGALIVEARVPLWPALLTLWAGIVTGDCILYGLGALARRLPFARRLLITEPVRSAQDWLEEHLVASVALCRISPGILFPTYVACGWFRLSLPRFIATSVFTAAVYTPVVVWLAIKLKTVLFSGLGLAGWGLLLLLLLALSVVGTRRRRQAVKARLEAARRFVRGVSLHLAHEAEALAAHRGMPPIDRVRRRVSVAERVPPILFYIPFGLHWIYLGLRYRSFTLPSAANPNIEAGGMWGESKSACLRQIAPEFARWIAPFVRLERTDGNPGADDNVRAGLAALQAAGLAFPIVAKPDIGWQGYGVRLVGSEEALEEYVRSFPVGQTMILQKFVPCDGEAGILYARVPGEPRGRILSITLRYFPFVVGDGTATLRDLIRRDPRAGWKARHHLGTTRWHLGQGTHDLDMVPREGQLVRLSLIGSIRVGGLYRDATAYATPALEERIDAMARSMPEFHFGRFDIRFQSMERLQAGEDFAVIEVNGAGAEAIHIWDPDKSFWSAYGTLLRSLSLVFDIGARNRARGFRPATLRELIHYTRKQHRLILQYPPSG
jgi:membrane protein DedA with SNARE-associated domain